MPLLNRKPTRLTGYNYSQPGIYYVTICGAERIPLFGTINNATCELSYIGKMIEESWCDIPLHYPDVKLDEYIIMPDHIHGIIVIEQNLEREVRENRLMIDRNEKNRVKKISDGQGRPSLLEIVRWFKSLTTHKYWLMEQDTRNPKAGKLWQRSYADRVIRNEYELNQKRHYIAENPLRWSIKHHPE